MRAKNKSDLKLLEREQVQTAVYFGLHTRGRVAQRVMFVFNVVIAVERHLKNTTPLADICINTLENHPQSEQLRVARMQGF